MILRLAITLIGLTVLWISVLLTVVQKQATFNERWHTLSVTH